MRRRSKAGGKPVKARRRKTAKMKPRDAPKVASRRSSSAASPDTEVARLSRELTEALEQQAATANVLEVISRSAFDLNAVFETVAESSVRLCGADRGSLFRFDGELLRIVVLINASQEFKEWVEQHPIRPGSHSAAARAALERRTIHIPDASKVRQSQSSAPIHTMLSHCNITVL